MRNGREVALAWTPYALLVVLVLLWGDTARAATLERSDRHLSVAGAAQRDSANAAGGARGPRLRRRLHLQLLSAAGTACLFAACWEPWWWA